MPSLSQIQDEFQRYLLDADRTIEQRVVGTDRVPIDTRLGIYGGGYGARLTEALQINFPVLAELLGESDFETLSAAYIRAHDSTFTSIRYYGDALPEFLAANPTYGAVPLLAELARWEWAMTETFDAADAQVTDAGALASVSPEQWSELRFTWHPSIRRLGLSWNVPQLWKAATNETQRPEASLSAEPGQWLLWRRDLDTFFRSLASPESAALDAARGGSSFGEVCDLLCQWVSEAEAPASAAGLLRDWLQSGLIASIEIG